MTEDISGGQVGASVQRMLDSSQQSESQTRVICGQIDAGVPADGQQSAYDFISAVATDDFVSLAAQFNEFRVTAIWGEFVIINPSIVTVSNSPTVGATHLVLPSSTATSFTQANIVDFPGSVMLTPSGGKSVIVWKARGALERQFQSTGLLGTAYVNYGGIYIFHGSATASPAYYSANLKYVVDFRGRR